MNLSSNQLAHSLFDLHSVAIKRGLEQDGYFILKNDEFANLVTAAKNEYFRQLSELELHPQKSRLDRKSLTLRPWRKLAIGATNGVGEPYAQFLTTTYFSENTSGLEALNKVFSTLLELRNRLFGIPHVLESDGIWDACRIHHYPRGGGFMSEHRDTHFPKVLGTSGMPFLQVSACMSKRGADFHTGGGFVIDKHGEKIDLEAYGSIVMFDGNQRHGVDCIDLDTLPDYAAQTGRLAAFTNIYEILS